MTNFTKEYEELCKKHNKRIVAYPVFVARDDGSFSVVVRLEVVDTSPKPEEKPER